MTAQDPSFSRYVSQIVKTPMLSAEDEIRLFREWKEGSARAKDRIVRAHMRLVYAIAAKHRGYSSDLDDLVSEGTLGLVHAMDKFEPERGLRFSTYARWWVKAKIIESVQNNWSLLKMGTTVHLKMLFFKLRGAKERLGIMHEGAITDEEAAMIAEDLGVPVQDVHTMDRRLASRGEASLDIRLSEDSDATALDLIEDETMSIDAREAAIDLASGTRLIHDAMADLKPRERHIIERRRLIEDYDTLDELSQVYGVTRERIRQIEVKAFDKLSTGVRRRMEDRRIAGLLASGQNTDCLLEEAIP